MDVAAGLPTMEDTALAVLHANAERLMRNGTAAQQSAAAALMPSIQAEIGSRNAVKLSRKADAVAARRASRAAKTAPRPTEAETMDGHESA
jgi:hypothetical protein